jgi:hypothetical protein
MRTGRIVVTGALASTTKRHVSASCSPHTRTLNTYPPSPSPLYTIGLLHARQPCSAPAVATGAPRPRSSHSKPSAGGTPFADANAKRSAPSAVSEGGLRVMVAARMLHVSFAGTAACDGSNDVVGCELQVVWMWHRTQRKVCDATALGVRRTASVHCQCQRGLQRTPTDCRVVRAAKQPTKRAVHSQRIRLRLTHQTVRAHADRDPPIRGVRQPNPLHVVDPVRRRRAQRVQSEAPESCHAHFQVQVVDEEAVGRQRGRGRVVPDERGRERRAAPHFEAVHVLLALLRKALEVDNLRGVLQP